MDCVAIARRLAAAGKFTEALKVLDQGGLDQRDRTEGVLRAELLERVGRHGQGKDLAEKVLRARDSNHDQQGRAEFVLGLIAWEDGLAERAVVHLQRSISMLRKAGNFQQA